MTRVLILGATSAIAGDIARIYARGGATLFLVGRSEEKLAALRDELGESVAGSQSADFIDFAGNTKVIGSAILELGGLDVALIAHGMIGDQLLSERDEAEAARIMDVNYRSAVSLLIPLANTLEAQGHGHLAVLSSVAGERGRPRNYTYGAAKGALTLYLQGVRSRLWPHVGVHTIKLGPVDTPMTVNHPKNRLFASSPAVAERIVRVIDAGVSEAYVPWYWRPIMFAVRNLPEALFQRAPFLSGR